MNNELKEICDMTIKNYRYAVQNLRYDGDYINHFSALLNGYHKKEIQGKEVKEIRTYIKNKTSKMSSFRGDMLYILSFLISFNHEKRNEVINDTISMFDLLIEEGFDESEYLILASYSIVKYTCEEEREAVMKKMVHIFNSIKEKHGNLTKQDDYLLCALLAINGCEIESITEYMEMIFDYISDLHLFSKNGAQGLTNSILLNSNDNVKDNVSKLLIELENNDLKIGYQFLQLLGVLVDDQNIDKSIGMIKQVIEYLCAEESEYDFYIDKDFRNMIALVIVFVTDRIKSNKYIDELLAFGTYSFLLSKNQGIFNEILA